MGSLAKKLATHYKQVGNKIVFCGKYSLNELAIEMWEQLDFKGIDSSSLSRIIKGERLFTPEQLAVFCKVLKINKQRAEELHSALQNDLLSRNGIIQNFKSNSVNEATYLYESNVKQMRSLRERGFVDLIPEWADNTIKILEKYTSPFDSSNQQTNKRVLALSNAYFEKAYAYGCIYPGKESFKKVQPLIRKIHTISQSNKNNQALLQAKILASFNYYSLGKELKTGAISSFNNGYKIIASILKNTEGDGELELMAWRCLALNSIYLNDQSSFEHSSKQINRIILANNENPKMSFTVWALATVARGQSHFKYKNVEETLENIRQLDSNIPWTDPLRACALIRNELEVLENIDSQNVSYKKNKANEGLRIAQNLHYYRYINFFNNSLENI